MYTVVGRIIKCYCLHCDYHAVPSQPTSPRRTVVLSPARSVSPADKHISYSPKHSSTRQKSESWRKIADPKPSSEYSGGKIAAHRSLPQQKSSNLGPVHITESAKGNELQPKLTTTEATDPISITKTAAPEAKSVTFVSPVHQVYTIVDSSSPNSLITSPDHEYKHSTNPLHTVLTNDELDAASSNSLSGIMSPLEIVPSSESLDATSSEFSLSSRHSLPAPLRNKRHHHNLEDEITTADSTDGGTGNL